MKKVSKIYIAIWLLCIVLSQAAIAQSDALQRVLVNQAGYNKGESKRLVAWGISDGTPFTIEGAVTGRVLYKGTISGYSGDFTAFNPAYPGTEEYVAKVNGLTASVPFQVSPFFQELLSSKLAYEFFIDVRGSTDPEHSDEAKVYGGGPSRDGGAFTLEAPFELLFYASNPALFDNWKKEMGKDTIPDLIALILWHAEFAYYHLKYNGPVATRHGWLGYDGTPKMKYDYWNTLDQLAAVCAAYHTFLKPYLSEEKYQRYRHACLENWKAYDRHKEVRYWTYSTKWVDPGYQEFNEMGNAFGQSVFRNLFMYLCEQQEKDGKPEQFLHWAQEGAEDIIHNWNFNNPRHMWWIRNAEHITPQALAFFLLVAPEKAPAGTSGKLQGWLDFILSNSRNPWEYRVHSDTEWAHPKTKELGGAPALGGSIFAAAYVLNKPAAREQAWSQINFVFGLNPLGAHFSNKSTERLNIDGYWKGVEYGWPQAHPNGFGKLGLVRGTLDGTPLDADFPRLPHQVTAIKSDTITDKIGSHPYATEGWAISNRGWMATLTFASLHAINIQFVDAAGRPLKRAKKGAAIFIELKAPLDIHPDIPDWGWVELKTGEDKVKRIAVKETGPATGIFRTVMPLSYAKKYVAGYGYWGFRKTAVLKVP